MVRFISLLAVAAALAVAFLIPGSASAVVVNGCPPGFLLIPAFAERDIPHHGPFPADRNEDELVCLKESPSGEAIIIDNNVPDPIAEGVTDAGSSVPVDMATGEVLSG